MKKLDQGIGFDINDHQHNYDGCDCRDSRKCSCDCHATKPAPPDAGKETDR